MKLSKKALIAAILAAGLFTAGSANAWFGGWAPWNWFDDDDWYDYPPPWAYVYPGYAPYYGYGYAPYGYGYAPYGYGYGAYPYGAYPYAQPSTAPTKPSSPAPANKGK